jgi:hypothetical protein
MDCSITWEVTTLEIRSPIRESKKQLSLKFFIKNSIVGWAVFGQKKAWLILKHK